MKNDPLFVPHGEMMPFMHHGSPMVPMVPQSQMDQKYMQPNYQDPTLNRMIPQRMPPSPVPPITVNNNFPKPRKIQQFKEKENVACGCSNNNKKRISRNRQRRNPGIKIWFIEF